MIFLKEDQNYVFAECHKCSKNYKIKRQNLTLNYDGYRFKHGTVCSCGAVLKKIEGEVDTKHCPICAEKIADVLEICPHCEHDFKKAIDDEYAKKKKKFFMILFGFILLIVVVSTYMTQKTIEMGDSNTVVVEKQEAKDMDESELGEMYLVDSEGIYLGELSSDTTKINSILNPSSDYGFESADTNIWNENGVYGDKTSKTSAYNSKATIPPQIFYKGNFVAFVSKNKNLGKLTVDPDGLKQWIENKGY